MAQCDDDSDRPDQDVIACESLPSVANPAVLGKGVVNGEESAIGGVVRFPIVHRHHRPVDTGVDLPPESHELLGWLWAKERVESVDSRLAVFIDGTEVDRVRSRELGGAVTGDPIGWTVTYLPGGVK